MFLKKQFFYSHSQRYNTSHSATHKPSNFHRNIHSRNNNNSNDKNAFDTYFCDNFDGKNIKKDSDRLNSYGRNDINFNHYDLNRACQNASSQFHDNGTDYYRDKHSNTYNRNKSFSRMYNSQLPHTHKQSSFARHDLEEPLRDSGIRQREVISDS